VQITLERNTRHPVACLAVFAATDEFSNFERVIMSTSTTTVPSTVTVELSVYQLFHITESLAAAWRQAKIQTPTDDAHAQRIQTHLLQLEEVCGNLMKPYRELLLARAGK